MDLTERIKQIIANHRPLRRGERVVVAVSGGADSMVLLHLLRSLAPAFGWKLSVAHFNHQLRGRSSDADERFVRLAARKLGLACDVGQSDVRRHAERKKVSVEMAARELRHAFLARCARKRKARVVVLAQHADDQVELFLMRLMRGAGGAGLGGMTAQSGSPADRQVKLVRPLLEFSKAELAEFARVNRIRFRHDASNDSEEFDRNWVRRKLLPLLRERQPAIDRTLFRSLRIVRGESDFVRSAAREWLAGLRGKVGATLIPFAELHVAVQRQILQEQLVQFGHEPDYQLIEHLRLHQDKQVTVAPGQDLVRDANGQVDRAEPKSAEFNADRGVIEISLPGTSRRAVRGCVTLSGLRLNWRVLRKPSGWSLSPKSGVEYFDAGRVGARLLLRCWRPGDRFQPIGLPAATKLQDWFTNRKIPAALRRRLILAETERGDVFWVEGERIGEVGKVTDKTRRLLELRWKRS